MKLSTWLTISAVLYGGFGLGLLVIPALFMAAYGVALDEGGQLMARILGSALLAFMLIFWWSRQAAVETVQPLLRASLLYNIVDFFVVLFATLAGVFSVMGWVPVALHIFLSAGFGYFVFAGSKALQPAHK